MDLKIVRFSDLNKRQSNEAITIFVEGFYDLFSKITKKKDVLEKLFSEAFHEDMVYVCLIDNDVAGFLGLGDINKMSLELKVEDCTKIFGNLKGRMIFLSLAPVLNKVKTKNSMEAHIDYITTAKRYRGEGVAKEMLQYIQKELPFNRYSLQMLLDNSNAKKLYENVGFKQTKINNSLFTKISGVGKIIEMELIVNNLPSR